MLHKLLPFVMLSTVAIVTAQSVQSCLVGVTLASLGGGLAQMRRVDERQLTVGQTAAEWGLSGLAGFLTWTAVSKGTEDHWLMWASCLTAGLLGSAGLRVILERAENKDE